MEAARGPSTCPSCARESPPGARFCMHCAAPFALACTGCGGELPADARFCPQCARAVEAPGATSSPAGSAAEREPLPARSPSDYTPRHLADRILQSRSALEGERKRVTVLFADVKGSMELAEGLDPEEWHRILDRFFTILADGVHRFEGTVNQYTGDGVMALFGAPIAHEDHAQRACYAALHLAESLRDQAREVRREYGLDFAFRMGLNSGEVVVGKIGDDLRMDYTAQGHCVGLAQRMEALAEANACFVSDATAALVTGYFDLEDLGEFRVKGAGEPLRVYRLRGVGAARTRFDVSRARGLTRFVGRADDMQMLEAALDRARAGHGSVLGVVADAGTGKSRLCFEFAEACRASGLTVHEGRAVAHGKTIPLIPILELFRSYFEIGERDPDRSAREKIAGRLLLIDEGFREVLPALFDFLSVEDPENPAPRMEPEARQRQLFGVVRGLLKRSQAERPGILLVEDMHWLDPSSEAWLSEWVEATAGTHNLMLVNFRPEYHADWMQRAHYQQLSLAPLGQEAIRELIEALLGRDPTTAGLAEKIHAHTSGNPFFAEEVVRSLIESGHLAGSPGSYRLAMPVEKLAVPDSVQALLAARIDRLAEREKQVLQAASVIGKQFRGPVLERVVELPPRDLTDALSQLRSAEFVHEEALYPTAEYAFKHPLTQEVALGSQLRQRRRAAHRSVARAIEELDADRLDEQSATLAHHYDEAGEALPAARWHRRAADWAMRTDPGEAYRHWLRVHELASTLEGDEAAELSGAANLELVNLGWRIGLPADEARERFETARREFEANGEHRSLALLHSNYALTGGIQGSERADLYREANRIAAEHGDTLLRIAVGAPVWPILYSGRPREALERIDATALLTATVDDPGRPMHFHLRPWLHIARGYLLSVLGKLDEGVRESDRAIEIASDIGDDYDRFLALTFRTEMETWRGNVPAALDYGQRQLQLAEQIASPANRCIALCALGAAFGLRGDWPEALPLIREAVEIRNEIDYYMTFPILGRALLECGDPEGAVVAARDDLAYNLRLGSKIAEPEARITLATVLARGGGDPDEARAELALAAELTEAMGARLYEPEIREASAAVAERLGDAGARTRELTEAGRLYDEIGASGHSERIARELGS